MEVHTTPTPPLSSCLWHFLLAAGIPSSWSTSGARQVFLLCDPHLHRTYRGRIETCLVLTSPDILRTQGFGEDSIQSLPGNIGTQDVSDCMDALKAAVDAGYADPSRVSVCGGSHGGFLTGAPWARTTLLSSFEAAYLRVSATLVASPRLVPATPQVDGMR